MKARLYPIRFLLATALVDAFEVMDDAWSTDAWVTRDEFVKARTDAEYILKHFHIGLMDAYRVYKVANKRERSCVVAFEKMLNNADCEFRFCRMALEGR